jgi:AbrB family looped-hinge helix DNA binding protein
MGIKMGKAKVDDRGRLTLPVDIRDKLGLVPGTEVNVLETDRGVLIQSRVTKEEFIQELKGCITEQNQVQTIEPLDLKKIWGVSHAHD